MAEKIRIQLLKNIHNQAYCIRIKSDVNTA